MMCGMSALDSKHQGKRGIKNRKREIRGKKDGKYGLFHMAIQGGGTGGDGRRANRAAA